MDQRLPVDQVACCADNVVGTRLKAGSRLGHRFRGEDGAMTPWVWPTMPLNPAELDRAHHRSV
ncbi:hypothetical protein ABH37_10865 [Mycobacterium haemophilum]|uniref:Uncharacterized protein n=1 Tax=Mycobacterium haemophilum TaxID=29311 RepID=A0A0I9TQB5_9MYCO|nr:hypothetical protein ABH39_08315 [Mycobacterium haemophilum]KLO36331.1 hypothetical protein ABH38_12235 [Mycobacterium haemophilum]KLO42215.1 hypothetical protein ABH37_10865 [Mycobacterium haemophilum]KLO50017.1 hypothetical protein ABH36_08785 [Mycobacterium haemophilum]